MRVRLTVLVTRPRVLAEMVLDRLGVRIPNFMDLMIGGTSHPVSRVLWPLRAGDHPSVNAIAGILQPFGCAAYPDARASSPRTRPRPHGLLGLAPSGVCRAVTVTDDAVGPYPAVSPSPARKPAVCFLWHCPAGHPGWALPTTLLCGARTFLDSSRLPRSPGWLVRPSILRSLPHRRHTGNGAILRRTPRCAPKSGRTPRNARHRPRRLRHRCAGRPDSQQCHIPHTPRGRAWHIPSRCARAASRRA